MELRREGPCVCRGGVQTGGAEAIVLEGLCIPGGHARNPDSAEGMRERCEEGELCSDELGGGSSPSPNIPHKSRISLLQILSHDSI